MKIIRVNSWFLLFFGERALQDAEMRTPRDTVLVSELATIEFGNGSRKAVLLAQRRSPVELNPDNVSCCRFCSQIFKTHLLFDCR